MTPSTRSAALIVLAAAVALTGWVWVGPAPSSADGREAAPLPTHVAADPAVAAATAEAPDDLANPDWHARRTELGRGGTLASALEGLGLPAATGLQVVRAAGEQLELRRLPAQTGLTLMRDERGLPRSVAIRPEAERFLRLRLSDDDIRLVASAEWVVLPVETGVRTVAGRVRSSVAQAIASTPHGRILTPAFADIFQWDVDLLVDPRPGDAVSIVYEVRSLGPTPPDLPGFGRAASSRGEFLGLGAILAASYEGKIASATAYWVEDRENGGNYYDEEGRPLRKSFLKSPLNYRRISSRFSRARRNPVTRRVVPHHGVDFAADPGTPVVATADGTVASAGWGGPLGRCVRIRHGSEYVTIYGHLRGFARGIRRGAQVTQNQVIGYVGSSGRATGPHLHYTVVHGGRAIDPLRMKNPPVEPLDPALLPRLHEARGRWAPVLASLSPGAFDLAEADGASRPGAGATWVGL